MPTMNELRDTLGVSVVTLNRALSELEAQGIISRRHGVGIFVSPHLGQKTIGLVFDRNIFGANASPFWDMLISKARDRASSHNENFSLFMAMAMGSDDEGLHIPHDLTNALAQGRLHGVIFVGPDQRSAQWLEERVPLVAYANIHASHAVSIDGGAMVQLATQRLVEQGCRRIGLWIPTGLWVGPNRAGDSYPEMDAFLDVLKAADLPVQPQWIKEDFWRVPPSHPHAPGFPGGAAGNAIENTLSFQEQGYYLTLNVFGKRAARQDRPDGLVIVNDLMTRGAMTAFSKLNLKPGIDIKIATHANKGSTALLGYEDDLTLVQVDVAELVDTMYEMLETRIAGKELPLQRVSLVPHLRA